MPREELWAPLECHDHVEAGVAAMKSLRCWAEGGVGRRRRRAMMGGGGSDGGGGWRRPSSPPPPASASLVCQRWNFWPRGATSQISWGHGENLFETGVTRIWGEKRANATPTAI